MARLGRLWMATRTWGTVDSESPGPLDLIVDQDGFDVVHQTLGYPRPPQAELQRGRGSFIEIRPEWFLGVIYEDELTNSSVRVAIRTHEA